jgi:hypothetical protein
MSELDEAIREVRAAVREMVATAARAAATFTTPRAPGKWSPSQVTEHVARAPQHR